MKRRAPEAGPEDPSVTWGDFYRVRHRAWAIEQNGGDLAEAARLRAEAEGIEAVLRRRHEKELAAWRLNHTPRERIRQ